MQALRVSLPTTVLYSHIHIKKSVIEQFDSFTLQVHTNVQFIVNSSNQIIQL